MFLKDKNLLIDFFHIVQQCQGQVLYFSKEGDQLNLKSSLCQFLFSSALINTPMLLNGHIACEKEEDMIRLQPFLNM